MRDVDEPASSGTRGLDKSLRRITVAPSAGQASAESLFALERNEEITQLYKAICAEKGIAEGPAKAKAITQLWALEDHKVWEEKAKDLANDVET